ncbi:hypothetical protein MMC30_009418 [Trapelia coarctata]|nr:hypothetical protein [Trapelia coarctata]
MYLFKMLHVMFAILTSLTALNAATTSRKAVALPMTQDDSSNTTIDEIERRSNYDGQPSGMGITAFIDSDCGSSEHYFLGDLTYGSDYTYSIAISSFILSRDMVIGEQLDFSGGPGANPPCYPFIQATAPSQVGPVHGGQCYYFPPATCLRFWHH